MARPPAMRAPKLEAIEREAFAFAELCATPGQTADTVIGEFHRIVRSVGFTSAVGVGYGWLGKDAPARFYFNSLPDDWMKLIDELDLMRKGMAGNIEIYRHMAPFEAFSTVRARKLTALEQEAVEAQLAYGWRTLFAVPLHGPAGYRGGVVLITKEEIALTPRLSMALRVLALAVHDWCHADRKLGIFDPDPGLTMRELECLQGVVAGMSDKEIARRIGISPNTVKDHIDRARMKMKAPSRAAAAAFVVLLGKD